MAAPFSTATERDALCSHLDWTRDALIREAGGLSEEDVRAASTVSSLSLLSLLKHSAIWERRWFQVIFDGRTFPGEWPEVKDEGEGATLIQETARHAGHADIIREAIDGSRGL